FGLVRRTTTATNLVLWNCAGVLLVSSRTVKKGRRPHVSRAAYNIDAPFRSGRFRLAGATKQRQCTSEASHLIRASNEAAIPLPGTPLGIEPAACRPIPTKRVPRGRRPRKSPWRRAGKT